MWWANMWSLPRGELSSDRPDRARGLVTEIPAPGSALSHADVVYAIMLARTLFIDYSRRYSRVVEKLSLGVDSCSRDIRTTLLLPSLDDLGYPDEGLEPRRVIIPLTIMRRGQLYTGLTYTSESGPVRIISRANSSRLTRGMLGAEWSRALKSLTDDDRIAHGRIERLNRDVQPLLVEVIEATPRVSRAAVTQVERHWSDALASIFVADGPTADQVECFASFLAVAARLSRRNILWAELKGQHPGDVVEFTYSYSTRFAGEYGSVFRKQNRLAKAYGAWKRFVGQPPSKIVVPISRHALTRSYHVTMEAPAYCFFNEFSFVDQLAAHSSATAFQERAVSAGAQVGGVDEAGGATGHLYCYMMPSADRVHPAVRAHLMERPPGATASVAWLASFALGSAAFLAWRYEDILGPQSSQWSVIALAAPGIAALWFGQLLQSDTRRLLAVVARLALMSTVAVSALIAGMIIIADSGGTVLYRWPFVWIICLTHLPITLAVWQQRVRFHMCYRRHQIRISRKYGL